MVVEEYFNLGVEYGMGRWVVDDVLGHAGITDPALAPAAALRALALALVRITKHL